MLCYSVGVKKLEQSYVPLNSIIRVPVLTKTAGNNLSLELDERTREKTIEKEE
jgi:hypothetical protein